RVRIAGDPPVLTTERGDVAVQDLTTEDRLVLQGPSFGRTALPENVGLGIGIAVGDGCLTHSTIGGREQQTIILTMNSAEAAILASVADGVNGQKAALKVAGS